MKGAVLTRKDTSILSGDLRAVCRSQSKDTAQCSDIMPYYVYILKCSDGFYYTGSTSDLEKHIAEHQEGLIEDSYTHSRRPVELVWSAEFATHDEAFRCERQIKDWSRAKKEALIRGDWDGIHEIVKQDRKRQDFRHGKRKAP